MFNEGDEKELKWVNELKNKPINPNEFMFLNIKRGLKIKVFIEDIICCQADNSYTIFYLADTRKYMVSYPLKKIEEYLSRRNFIRANRAFIINPCHVKMIKLINKPSIILTNEMKLDVSKQKIKEIEQFLAQNYKCFTK